MSVTELNLSYDFADHEDVPVIFAMAKELIDTYEDISAIDYDKVISWVLNKICKNISDYQCVFLKGTKVGYYRLCKEAEQTELDDFYILPPFRGQGIGTAVLQHCIDTTNTPMFLYVFRKNLGAIKLYARKGFSVSEEAGKTRYILRREVDRPC
jgi:GNAT superfamily N-acetyltransferase